VEDLSVYNPEESALRKAQMRMLSILDVFVEICKRHNIDYWLYAGTALGAHRHGGFIPWDDDLDVIVRYKDFKKLSIIIQNELPSHLKLQTRKTDNNYPFYYAKIRDLNSVFHEIGSEKYKYRGVFIDLFPIEQVPNVSFKRIIDAILNSQYLFSIATGWKKKIKYFLIIGLVPFAKVYIYLSRLMFDKRGVGICEYTYGMRDYNHLDLSHFYPNALIEFEGKKYNAAGEIDKYLTKHYGKSYMTIPEQENRQIHSTRIEIF
jgi:lipopolysaccharide cholinephosphotransferase